MALDLVGIQAVEHLNRIFQLSTHDFDVSSSFKQAVSVLKRSGHARFRRGPLSSEKHVPSVSTQSEETKTSSFQTITSSSLFTCENLEGSVSNGKQVSSLGIVAPAPSFSSRKPPLPSSHRKRHNSDQLSASVQRSGSVSRSTCHCCKRRKTGSKREVRRIPITGSKVDTIPADDYSWKKYGVKTVIGSPFPRVYYKCNSSKGCPARKRVEVTVTDSKMLLVTYDREHRHHHAPTPLPVKMTGLQI